VDSNLALVLRR